MSSAIVGAISCGSGTTSGLSSIEDAGDKIRRVEPLSWWTGMNTPLQLLVHGENISEYDVRIEGERGVKVSRVHRVDSPNYLFVDIDIAPGATPGTYSLVFSRDGKSFSYPYQTFSNQYNGFRWGTP